MTKRRKKESKPKIYMGIPRERFLMPAFVDNRDAILSRMAQLGLGTGYFQTDGHRVDRNRDAMVKRFLEEPNHPTHLLMLDSDMEHPITAPERLLAMKKPIASALYFHRGQIHQPFVFRMAPPQEDEFGRPVREWAAMNDEVFDFLEANGIPMRDGAMVIDNPIGQAHMECDAVATGCMLIERGVLENMEKPIFEYITGGVSEDLVFCKRAKFQYDYPIFCDLSTICGHYSLVAMGQSQFRMLYRNAGINTTSYSKKSAADMYAAYFGLDEEEATKLIEAGSAHEVGPLWDAKFKGKQPTSQEIAEFYESEEVGKAYIMELLWWNFTQTFQALRQPLTEIRDSNVIEIGAGIGSVALQLVIQRNNVLAVEPNALLRGFIDMRYDDLLKNVVELQHFGTLSVVASGWQENCPDGSFAHAVAYDTFEHLDEKTLKEMLLSLHRILEPGGWVHYHANFGQQDIYPMHFNHGEWFLPFCMSIGFQPVGFTKLIKR